VVYDFQIGIRADTRTWDVRIENDTTHEVYNSLDLKPGGLGFKGNWTMVGGTLNFNARSSDTADVRQFSIDDVVITQDAVPEPSLIVLLLTSTLLLMTGRRRR